MTSTVELRPTARSRPRRRRRAGRRRSGSRPPPNLPPACSIVSTTSTAGRRSLAPGIGLTGMPRAVVVDADRAVGVDRDDDLGREARPSPRRSRCRRPRRPGGGGRGRWWCRCTSPGVAGRARRPRGPGCCWSRSLAWLLRAVASFGRQRASDRAARGGLTRRSREAVRGNGRTNPFILPIRERRPTACRGAEIRAFYAAGFATDDHDPDAVTDARRRAPRRPCGGSPRAGTGPARPTVPRSPPTTRTPASRLTGAVSAASRCPDDLGPPRRELGRSASRATKTSSREQPVDDVADRHGVARSRSSLRVRRTPSRAASGAPRA